MYDYLCWFYWLIDQDLGDGIKMQNIPWFADFLVEWAKLWGDFLDTTDSFSTDILATWRKESPKYLIEDSMIPDERHDGELRPNAPSGWLTFNQFFARELNPGLRPIAYPGDNRIITSPADSTYKKHYAIDEDSNISPPVTIKGTHTYANVQKLLEGSHYADCFAGGNFLHNFLGPYSYHRFHTPVAGIVKECAKGDEFGYFTFGGSDIIVLTQKGTSPVYNPAFVKDTEYYSLYGSPIANVTPLRT